jgi:formylglycine-generating enzyme required for sulfatase activity
MEKNLVCGVAGKDFRVESLELDMIWVEPGSFLMGDDDGEDNQKPARTVEITRGFWIGKTHITQAQYRSVLGSSPTSNNLEGDDNPVTRVSSRDAKVFIKALRKREPLPSGIPRGYLFRLPTEAE